MQYYSTNHNSPEVSLQEAVLRGLAPDNGLYMPVRIPSIPKAFFNNIGEMSLTDIAYVVANTLFGDDIDSDKLNETVKETLTFDMPLRHVADNRYALELFHGPTLASKDLGTRFMARLLRYFNRSINGETAVVNVLVATNGDAGAAVANGFHRIPGVRVYALYPKGKLSDIQEAQLTTLGDNVTALEVRGNFDDCQSIVREAFADEELNRHMILTSANSINVASLLPQTLFYFYAYAQLARSGRQLKHITFSVPGGNLGHLTAALVAKRMGLPYDNVIVVNNCNDIFYQYLATGEFQPRKPVSSMASALDVGNPTNMARILDLYGGDTDALRNDVTGKTYGDDDIARTIRDTRRTTDYILDPHGAIAYRALADMLPAGHTGVFLATSHPAKFKETVEDIIGDKITVPQKLTNMARKPKNVVKISASLSALKKHLQD